MTIPTTTTVREDPGSAMAGRFLEALAQRDFEGVQACLAPDLRFRALVPRGLIETIGADAFTAYLLRWFGGPDEFEVLGSGVGELASRPSLWWRVRMSGADGSTRLVEQQVFLRVGERIDAVDLLCSGFHLESTEPATVGRR